MHHNHDPSRAGHRSGDTITQKIIRLTKCYLASQRTANDLLRQVESMIDSTITFRIDKALRESRIPAADRRTPTQTMAPVFPKMVSREATDFLEWLGQFRGDTVTIGVTQKSYAAERNRIIERSSVRKYVRLAGGQAVAFGKYYLPPTSPSQHVIRKELPCAVSELERRRWRKEILALVSKRPMRMFEMRTLIPNASNSRKYAVLRDVVLDMERDGELARARIMVPMVNGTTRSMTTRERWIIPGKHAVHDSYVSHPPKARRTTLLHAIADISALAQH